MMSSAHCSTTAYSSTGRTTTSSSRESYIDHMTILYRYLQYSKFDENEKGGRGERASERGEKRRERERGIEGGREEKREWVKKKCSKVFSSNYSSKRCHNYNPFLL